MVMSVTEITSEAPKCCTLSLAALIARTWGPIPQRKCPALVYDTRYIKNGSFKYDHRVLNKKYTTSLPFLWDVRQKKDILRWLSQQKKLRYTCLKHSYWLQNVVSFLINKQPSVVAQLGECCFQYHGFYIIISICVLIFRRKQRKKAWTGPFLNRHMTTVSL